MRSKKHHTLTLMSISLFAATLLWMMVKLGESKLTPCNPVCFPKSYDKTNPDCFCNQK